MTIIENQKSLNAQEIQKIRHNLANITLALECSIENLDKKFVTPQEFRDHICEILLLVKNTGELLKK